MRGATATVMRNSEECRPISTSRGTPPGTQAGAPGGTGDGLEFSALTLRLLLLFLPGLVGFYLIIDKLTVHRRFKLHAILLYSLLHGFASYWVYGLIVRAVFVRRVTGAGDVLFFRAILDDAVTINLREVAADRIPVRTI